MIVIVIQKSESEGFRGRRISSEDDCVFLLFAIYGPHVLSLFFGKGRK